MNLKFNNFADMLLSLSTEQSCREYLERERWGDNPACPYCTEKAKAYKLSREGYYKCSFCRERFSVTVKTIFEGSHIPLRKWFIAIWLFQAHKKGVSCTQLAEDLDITVKSSWFMLHRLRVAMEANDQFLNGNIELDETFVGGKNKNRHYDKKVEQSQGRSFKDKTPVFGMMQKADTDIIERPNKKDPTKTVKEKIYHTFAKVICKVVPDTKGASLRPLIRKHIAFGSTITSDEWWAYSGLHRQYNHDIVDHRRGEYVNQRGSTTNNIEGFWTWVKKTYSATYHIITRKHLQKYVDEIAFRYNYHRVPAKDRMNILLWNCFGKRLTYKQLIAK